MSNRFQPSARAVLPLATVLFAASPCHAGWGTLNKDYGGSLQMMLYTPTTPAASPAILVAIHYCSGHASDAKWFDSAAEKNGFFVIAPDAGQNCFDSSATRTGDRADIVKMVDYVVTQKKADKSRVFAAGFSSGGCMTNTLLAIYPDVFAGGSALPGYPAGAWPAGDHSCSLCGNTSVPNRTPQQWGDLARTAFAYTGTRPCVQEWVGEMDQYSFNEYFPSVTAQFTNLMGLGGGTAGTGAPSGWNRTVYKDSAGNVRYEANVSPTAAHDLTGSNLAGSVVGFLGLDKSSGACGLSTGSGGSGGAPGTGGSGGTMAAGGAKPGSGGTSGGSAIGSSGAAMTDGGAASAAGAPGSAGAMTGMAGATALSGGAPSGSAGSAPTAGALSTAAGAGHSAGATGSASSNADSGCSCSTVGTAYNRSGLTAMIALTAFCAGAARRRKHAM